MPRSRGAVKRTKTKVVQSRIKKKRKTMPEPVAGGLWKEKGTVRGNYSAMGLAAAVNQDASVAVSCVTRKGKMDPSKTTALSLGTGQLQVAGHTRMRAEIKDVTVDERSQAVDVITEATSYPAPPRLFMFEGDQEFVEALLAKYGESDYEKMARDKRINVYQHTPSQIRKKVEKYMKLKAEWESGERGKEGTMQSGRGRSQQLPCCTWNVKGERLKI
mmetsp:Transcript_56655/g.139054  ORF Transcript_56655/g.139054 Transcript_56655/m.139054 type:complete len:217 (-) Transcript_56655:342-992(-)